MFNFKNVECQKVFQNLTSQTSKFTECFENNFNFKDQALKWNKTLNSFCHQSFKKVRITPNVPKITKVTELMEDRKSLKQKMKICEEKSGCEDHY